MVTVGEKRIAFVMKSLLVKVAIYSPLLTPCSKTLNLIKILEKIADDVVKATGFFHSGEELYCNKLHPHPE